MNTKEFSSQFDILYNSIMSNQAPSIDEYEKSVFLTKAQNELIKNYYTRKGNKYQEGIDNSTRRTLLFKNLITNNSVNSTYKKQNGTFEVPIVIEPMFILNIKVIANNCEYVGKILSPDEYDRIVQRPYKMPLRNQAWIVIDNKLISDDNTRHIPSMNVITNDREADSCKVNIRYIKKPMPIVLANLEEMYEGEKITINKISDVSECELDSSFHEEILQRAVELATASYKTTDNFKVSTAIGQRSE